MEQIDSSLMFQVFEGWGYSNILRLNCAQPQLVHVNAWCDELAQPAGSACSRIESSTEHNMIDQSCYIGKIILLSHKID
jgi:hypothetical protein